jgi:hypothetical protein
LSKQPDRISTTERGEDAGFIRQDEAEEHEAVAEPS